MLDRLEDRSYWFDTQGRPSARSVGQSADVVSRDADLVSVLELWSGRKDRSVTQKLDVPKERFILYPGASRETDSTQLLGWAGWDHAQQALALAAVIAERESEGWSDERLVPLVAGLAELQPWVRQWHDETDPTYQLNLADYLDEELRGRAHQVGLTLDQLKAWTPRPVIRGRRPRA